MKGQMNEPFNHLVEASWTRKLTPEEKTQLQQWIAAHPENQEAWQTEAALNSFLDRLPQVPVSSNFTARVLQTVELETAAANRISTKRKWSWHSFLPKAAFASVFVVMTILSYREAIVAKRQRLARSVMTVSQVASLPAPEILEDFDAIQQLNHSPAPDMEWLALLQ